MQNSLVSSGFEKPKHWNWLFIPALLFVISCAIFSLWYLKSIYTDTNSVQQVKSMLLTYTMTYAVVALLYLSYICLLHKRLNTGIYTKKLVFLEIAAYIFVIHAAIEVFSQFKIVLTGQESMHPNWIPPSNWETLGIISFFTVLAFLTIRLIIVRYSFAKRSKRIAN